MLLYQVFFGLYLKVSFEENFTKNRFQSRFSRLQPSGIEKIAAKKGKVYGDTHDTHRWTKEQLEELNVRHS